MTNIPIKIQFVKSLSTAQPSRIVAVKADSDTAFSLFVTDKTGISYPLKDLQNNVIITNTDGNLQITSSSTSTNINLTTSILSTINSALQNGDNISELINDVGYITLADVDGTDLTYSSSLTDGTIISSTGSDAIIPLASIVSAGLLSPQEKQNIASAIQLEDLANVATSGNYEDLNNIPTIFNPAPHTHPISDIVNLQTNLDLKQDNLVSGVSIKTLEGQNILGSGNIDLTKTDVGLSNVDNTSDINKPISIAQQNSLDLKANIVHSATHELGGTDVIQGENLSVNVIPPTNNYSPVTSTLKGHLQGIDQALGTVVQTTAGLTNRIYYTADVVNVSGTNYFTSSANNKGTVVEALQMVINGDDTKSYFTQDIISVPQPFLTTAPSGSFTGQLSVRVSNDSAQERFTVEIYKTNNSGIPIASGVTGAPVGNLGVTVVAILDSGIIDLVQNSTTNIPVTGILNSNLTLNVGERLRYHISAEKIGTVGDNFTFSLYLGNAHNSYYDVPVIFNTDTVLNRSLVSGITASDAFNTLNANKEDKSNKATALTASSTLYPNNDAVIAGLATKEDKANKVTSIGSSANDTNYPSELAVKTYADNLVVGMLNDRGTWNASVNAFPTTGGSGTSGAIRKGDMWYVSVAGNLGGKAVGVGDSFRALVNSPAQVASNWSVLEANIGYVPANDNAVVHLAGTETITGAKTFSANLIGQGSITALNSFKTLATEIILSDSYGATLRGTRFLAWTDNFDSRFFQIGGISDNVVISTQNGLKANRLMISSLSSQISSGNFYNTIAPSGIFEVTNGTNRFFNVFASGNSVFGGSTDDLTNRLQVTGTVSSGTTTLGDTQPTANNQLTRKDYVDTGLATKEPSFAKNTAFNKNFGTTAGTVVEGGTLGSNAYNSTSYLPLSGGTLTGNLTISTKLNLNSEITDTFSHYINPEKWEWSTGIRFNSGDYVISSVNGLSADKMRIDQSGKTTFSSSVTAKSFSSPSSFDAVTINTNGFSIEQGYNASFISAYRAGGFLTDLYFNALKAEFSNNVNVLGTVTSSGGFFTSDKRLKTILKRDGDVAYFKWKDGRDSKTHIGYIAQEVRKTNPDQVQADDKGVLSVNYVEILVFKLREMEKKLELQSKEIEELKRK